MNKPQVTRNQSVSITDLGTGFGNGRLLVVGSRLGRGRGPEVALQFRRLYRIARFDVEDHARDSLAIPRQVMDTGNDNRPERLKGLPRTLQSARLASFDIHIDEIDAFEVQSLDELVDRNGFSINRPLIRNRKTLVAAFDSVWAKVRHLDRTAVVPRRLVD
jgi:hypothetical protein